MRSGKPFDLKCSGSAYWELDKAGASSFFVFMLSSHCLGPSICALDSAVESDCCSDQGSLAGPTFVFLPTTSRNRLLRI